MAVGMRRCGAALAKRSAMAFVATSFALFGLRCRVYAFFMAACFTDEDARLCAPWQIQTAPPHPDLAAAETHQYRY